MLVVNYNENKPIADRHKFSVQGNNNADKIRFVLTKKQGDIDLTDPSLKIYVKSQSPDKSFLDKEELTGLVVEGNEAHIDWLLKSKHTNNKQLEVALSFEDNVSVVWQTQLFSLSIPNAVASNVEIENTYPTILAQLQTKIENIFRDYDELPTPSKDLYHCFAFVNKELYTEVSYDLGTETITMVSSANNQEVKLSNIQSHIDPSNPLFIDLGETTFLKVYTAIVSTPWRTYKPFRIGTASVGGELCFYLTQDVLSKIKRARVRYSHYFTYNPTTETYGGDANASISINAYEIDLPTAETGSEFTQMFDYEVDIEELKRGGGIFIASNSGNSRVYIHSIEIATEEEGEKGYQWRKIPMEVIQ